MQFTNKYMEIIDVDGNIRNIQGYKDHYVDNGFLTVKYTTDSGGDGTYSKVMSDIKSLDLHMDITIVKDAPIEHVNVDITIKKDD